MCPLICTQRTAFQSYNHKAFNGHTKTILKLRHLSDTDDTGMVPGVPKGVSKLRSLEVLILLGFWLVTISCDTVTPA